MANNAKNVKLGVCEVMYGGEDLGFTKGGVSVSVSTDTHEVKVDQRGDTPINEFVKGRKCTVKVPLAETDMETLMKIMPGATPIKDDKGKLLRVDVPTSVGTSLLESAKPLILHPINLPASDKSEDFVVFLAGTAGALDFAYKEDDERVFNCEFKAYPNDKNLLFSIGQQPS